jgi:hypothetical protein
VRRKVVAREDLGWLALGRNVVPAVGKRAHDAGGPGISVEGTVSLVWMYMYLVKTPRARKSHISVLARHEIRFMPSGSLGETRLGNVFSPRDTSLERKDLWEIKYDRSDGIVGIAQLFATPLSVQTTVPARFQPANNIPVRPSQPFGIIVFVVVMVISIPSGQEAHSTSNRRLGLAPPKSPKDPSSSQPTEM